ncbi:hypothetical protein GCM10023329_29610 [Streptomyces sanyensis]|uniref:Uncharacterized protein n=1 Tax=Streptomyces sanyensis TaxID=568869 RepID=A0ABP9ABZ8_9ACTN
MSTRFSLSAATAVLIAALALAGPAAAASATPVAADVFTLSVGRIGASLSALTGLIGSVCGGIALTRTTGKGRAAAWARRNGPVTALVTGLIAAAVGGTVAATAKGGLGTGNGLGGAYVAVLLGLIAVISRLAGPHPFPPDPLILSAADSGQVRSRPATVPHAPSLNQPVQGPLR